MFPLEWNPRVVASLTEEDVTFDEPEKEEADMEKEVKDVEGLMEVQVECLDDLFSTVEVIRKKLLESVGSTPPAFSSLNEFRDVAYDDAASKGWHDNDKPEDLPTRLCLIHSEVSEALEEYRKGKAPDEVYYVEGKPEGVPIEIADIIIRLMDFCGTYGIDVDAAVKTKMGYNRTRSHKHGGKKI